jgi:hypothetical protein
MSGRVQKARKLECWCSRSSWSEMGGKKRVLIGPRAGINHLIGGPSGHNAMHVSGLVLHVIGHFGCYGGARHLILGGALPDPSMAGLVSRSLGLDGLLQCAKGWRLRSCCNAVTQESGYLNPKPNHNHYLPYLLRHQIFLATALNLT